MTECACVKWAQSEEEYLLPGGPALPCCCTSSCPQTFSLSWWHGIAHLFHPSSLGSLLYPSLLQLVSEILWGLPVTFSLQIPTLGSSSLQRSHWTVLQGLLLPNASHLAGKRDPRARSFARDSWDWTGWIKVFSPLSTAVLFCSADGPCIVEWAVSDFPFALDAHHSSGGNCWGNREFNGATLQQLSSSLLQNQPQKKLQHSHLVA